MPKNNEELYLEDDSYIENVNSKKTKKMHALWKAF